MPRPVVNCSIQPLTLSESLNWEGMAAAAPVKVYGPAMSPAVARVLACLLEKDVQFQHLNVDMAKREHKSPNFLKLQPFGQVPAFEDGNISIFESRAICRYISEKYSNQGNTKLYGINPLEKASIDQWVEAESQNFNPPSSALVFQLVLAPMFKKKPDENVIKENQEKLGAVLDVYDKRLGESRFLAGEDFSLADLSHLPYAEYLVGRTGLEELFTSRKNVERWWVEVSNMKSWKKVAYMMKSPPQQP